LAVLRTIAVSFRFWWPGFSHRQRGVPSR